MRTTYALSSVEHRPVCQQSLEEEGREGKSTPLQRARHMGAGEAGDTSWGLLCARHCPRCLTHSNSLSTYLTSGRLLLIHFASEETEAQELNNLLKVMRRW